MPAPEKPHMSRQSAPFCAQGAASGMRCPITRRIHFSHGPKRSLTVRVASPSRRNESVRGARGSAGERNGSVRQRLRAPPPARQRFLVRPYRHRRVMAGMDPKIWRNVPPAVIEPPHEAARHMRSAQIPLPGRDILCARGAHVRRRVRRRGRRERERKEREAVQSHDAASAVKSGRAGNLGE